MPGNGAGLGSVGGLEAGIGVEVVEVEVAGEETWIGSFEGVDCGGGVDC